MNLRIRLLFVATLGLALLPSMEARAGVIQGVTISDVSSEYVSGGDTRRATNLVNGVGLFGESHTAIAAGSMWLTLSGSAGTQVGTNYVTFDLGSVHNLNRMKVWNYNEQKSGANILTRRGVKSADILTAGDDLVFSTAIANQSFTRAAGLFTNLYDTIDLGGVSARYVRINIHTNFGEGDFRVGLSKVLFIDDTVPPVVKTATHDSSGTRVTVQFSETVLPSTATDTNNYSITSGTNVVAVLGASLNVFGDRVELQTGPMDSKVDYVLNVQNVRDAANVISITNTQVSIDPELVLWLKADAGITTDENGNVTEWDD
ncbi:MAG TPA: Ig-like domain-containing protein, partial [Verrucomicrobiae bacterium]|nr:Ig-like domain-containing protein [Verrucomicrobiae bacterium]